MSNVHIYSKLANSQKYTVYSPPTENANDVPRVVREILIKGGAGLATKHLITPNGVHTAITAEEYAHLKNVHLFKVHVEKGFIHVDDKQFDVDQVVSDMGDAQDPSAPLTPSDFEGGDGDKKIAVTTGKKGK